jgi:RNA polymerase sigma factor (sigma-70 family)
MKAHEVLYRSYSTPVYTLATRMLQNAAQADEILQETAIEVIRKLDTVRDDRAFAGWVKRIAVNKCLGHLRSAWHRLAVSPGAGADGDTAWAEGSDHGHGAASVHGAMDLAHALSLLPPVTRTVVWLHDVEGYTHGEIGRLMDKTASFSKSQLSRAHKRLRDLLAETDGDVTCMPQQSNC